MFVCFEFLLVDWIVLIGALVYYVHKLNLWYYFKFIVSDPVFVCFDFRLLDSIVLIGALVHCLHELSMCPGCSKK